MNFSFDATPPKGTTQSEFERLKRALVDLLDRESKKILEDIRASMRAPKSGRRYYGPRGPYIASAPGESPAVKSGKLIGSLRARKSRGGLRVRIAAEVGYGKLLEYGTPQGMIAPRPFMGPAKNAATPRIEKGIQSILSNIRRRPRPV